MLDHDRHILFSSAESGWRSPAPMYDALYEEFFFCLDAAADAASSLCQDYIGPDKGESGLLVDWAARIGLGTGLGRPIWLNPPYSVKEWRKTRNPALLIQNWAEKCWNESRRGCTVVGVFPFSPQTDWYRKFVMGIDKKGNWLGHAAMQERRLPHRVKFLHPDGTPAGTAGVNTVIVVWTPADGMVGPWQPHSFYWSYRGIKARVYTPEVTTQVECVALVPCNTQSVCV